MNTGSPKDAAALVSVVAQNIRSRRTARGLSLGELAALAGVGKSTLSMLEAGKGNPSIETLLAIAAALGVPFGHLVEPPVPRVRVVRAGEGIHVDAEESRMHVELLTSSHRRSSFELYVLHASPGPAHAANPHIDGAVEHLLILEGRLRVGPDGGEVELGPGDLASFAGDAAHRYEALEDGTRAVMLMEYT